MLFLVQYESQSYEIDVDLQICNGLGPIPQSISETNVGQSAAMLEPLALLMTMAAAFCAAKVQQLSKAEVLQKTEQQENFVTIHWIQHYRNKHELPWRLSSIRPSFFELPLKNIQWPLTVIFLISRRRLCRLAWSSHQRCIWHPLWALLLCWPRFRWLESVEVAKWLGCERRWSK